MTRRASINRDPIRAPAEQPPLFYRDGRSLSAAERGIVPSVAAEPIDELPPTDLAAPPFDSKQASSLVLPVLAVVAIIAAGWLLRIGLFGGLLSALMVGAIVKQR